MPVLSSIGSISILSRQQTSTSIFLCSLSWLAESFQIGSTITMYSPGVITTFSLFKDNRNSSPKVALMKGPSDLPSRMLNLLGSNLPLESLYLPRRSPCWLTYMENDSFLKSICLSSLNLKKVMGWSDRSELKSWNALEWQYL